jgi:L,D-transpeptidase catalytic domain
MKRDVQKTWPRGMAAVGAGLLLCLLPACETSTSRKESAAALAPGKPIDVGGIKMNMLFDWNGAGVKGPVSIRINRDEQMARIYKGGQEVSGHRTPAGSFRILEKKKDKHSNLWGTIQDASGNVVVSDARNGRDRVPTGGKFSGARMAYWMRLTGSGIGMHRGPIPNPGSPASHGCIRLPGGMAEILFSEVSVGTPVTIE